MQIGSASFYAAPLPSSQAARSPSSELSSPTTVTADPVEPQSLDSTQTASAAQSSAPGSERQSLTSGEKESPTREAARLRQEELELAGLVSRDREVRAHEQAHAAVGGGYAGAPTYTFRSGPDGKRYAVGGEVGIDTSPVPNDPAATLRKMEVVIRAALAPAEPSAQDRSVAAQATAQAAQARVELAQQQREEEVAAAEERAVQRAEREAEEEEKAAEQEPVQQAPATPPKLDLYLRLAQLQSPEPVVDLSI
ncbi:putative metalloprotease CJM1_0395 family protein [Pseudomonas sp. BMS12]|uniref:putative metalloprotease CJM1_0395 family protein n=1 Tax=Pseudomonas sp. BMS12 TaxID=1796033 RepID=UPI00083A96F6|nr:putative metalloprotease CJM1_0395 family protein [Pseudomonas sp. BMS12]